MERVSKAVLRLSRMMNGVAEFTLTFMMLLTVADVIFRSFRRPIVGTFELVAFSGAVVIGFAIPLTSWMRGHVSVDLFTSRLSQRVRTVFDITTRCLVIALFFLLGWRLVRYGMHLNSVKEVSMTLQLPFYPVAYGLALCSFVQCLVLLCDIFKILRGEYE